MTKEKAVELLQIYAEAWTKRDPFLLPRIFTVDVSYSDPSEPEVRGLKALAEYWDRKVVKNQENINFNLLNVWIESDTVIAEWRATFDDIERELHVVLDEIAILAAKNNLFSSLREYYKAAKVPRV